MTRDLNMRTIRHIASEKNFFPSGKQHGVFIVGYYSFGLQDEDDKV